MPLRTIFDSNKSGKNTYFIFNIFSYLRVKLTFKNKIDVIAQYDNWKEIYVKMQYLGIILFIYYFFKCTNLKVNIIIHSLMGSRM